MSHSPSDLWCDHTFAITSIPIFYGINFLDFAELLECISKVFFGILFITYYKQT